MCTERERERLTYIYIYIYETLRVSLTLDVRDEGQTSGFPQNKTRPSPWLRMFGI